MLFACTLVVKALLGHCSGGVSDKAAAPPPHVATKGNGTAGVLRAPLVCHQGILYENWSKTFRSRPALYCEPRNVNEIKQVGVRDEEESACCYGVCVCVWRCARLGWCCWWRLTCSDHSQLHWHQCTTPRALGRWLFVWWLCVVTVSVREWKEVLFYDSVCIALTHCLFFFSCVRCACDDVQAIQRAKQERLPIRVVGTGHSPSDIACTPGMMISTAALRDIQVIWYTIGALNAPPCY